MSSQVTSNQSSPSAFSSMPRLIVVSFTAIAVLAALSYLFADSAVQRDKAIWQKKQDSLSRSNEVHKEVDKTRVEEFKRYVSAIRDSLDKNPNDGTMILNLASVYFDYQLFDKAAPLYQRYIDQFGTKGDDGIIVDLGFSLFKSGQRAKGKQLIADLLQKHPNHPSGLFDMGVILFEESDKAEALRYFALCAKQSESKELAEKAQGVIDNIGKKE